MGKHLHMFKLDLEKAEESEIKVPTYTETARKFQEKKSACPSLTMLKPLTVWITTNYGKFLKRWEYQASWEVCMQIKKHQLEPDMEQWTDSKLEN